MNRNEFTQALLEFARRIVQAKTQREKKRIIAERDLFIRNKGGIYLFIRNKGGK